jgi:hypothetical protein
MPSLLSWQMTCTRDEGRCCNTESVGLILDRDHTCIIVLAFTLLCAMMHHLSMLKQLGDRSSCHMDRNAGPLGT